ncbi:hypothetical protein ABZ327_34725, partial [Streptomyces sp. NPDC006135]|uniref:hypothetical protein n=1 Tax=Streptomyces sp. NPDC006135 TaxID=3154577 RepID=UPI0033EC871A
MDGQHQQTGIAEPGTTGTVRDRPGRPAEAVRSPPLPPGGERTALFVGTSWADLMILTGNVALEQMGFETFGFAGGR